MPARTRHAPSTATEVIEPEETQTPGTGLQFNEQLSWRAGKAIPVGNLLDRLQKLANELRKLDQEQTQRNSLTKVSQDLASQHLLSHRDKGVRAWTACCLVDTLRLCAPDAPFTGTQLRDIFTTIITSIIPSLADPSNAYNSQHIYVLTSLAEVKSIILLTDLDSADALVLPLFTSCFDIVSGSSKASTGEELAKNVEYDMTRLLVTVIDESASLAPEVVDIIIAQFLRVDPRTAEHSTGKSKRNGLVADSKQETLLLKEYPAAYNMAKAICGACTDKMTSYISQYFNNVIIDASAPATMNGGTKHAANRRFSLDDSDEEGEDLNELSKAHRLIRELWRACPDVLQNVIPQLEAELSAESVSLRLLATQTLGDVVAGIGVAGPPPPAVMDPAAYPPVSLMSYKPFATQPNVLLIPLSPKPFSQSYSAAYDSFLSRRQDKSANIRAVWATAIGRILMTSAGGVGLSENEEQKLMGGLAHMLGDADEKVRASAVRALGSFGFSDVVNRLGSKGGVSKSGSVLAVLAERVKDRKHAVREEAMKVLARMWGVAAGDIEANDERVVSVIGDAPNKIFDAFYTNDADIHALLDHVLFELLLPLSYPQVKSKSSKSGANQTQKGKDSQNSEIEGEEADAEKIRIRRVLTLVKHLDERSKRVFFAMQARQVKMSQWMAMYLKDCEEYNGGVIENNEEAIKTHLKNVIDMLLRNWPLPDPTRISADLWKFTKTHDRRNYQLIRYAMAAESDYRTVFKAVKELLKRIQGAPTGAASVLDTLTSLLYRSSLLVYNRSHIPAIMELSRTEDHGLANAAHEMLKQISSTSPETLKAHVQEMCRDLESQAPSPKRFEDHGTEETLKACAGFAKKFASEIPKDRKFLVAMTNYALYSSSPRAAKHAVSIIMAAADKKEMYAKELIQKCTKNWSFDSEHSLTRLATISQLNFLAPIEADEESDAIISIAINQILLNNRSPALNADHSYTWSDNLDPETAAKELALKTLCNRIRSTKHEQNADPTTLRELAKPVYQILSILITNEGELSKKKDTPPHQKSRLRLFASRLLLKLCSTRKLLDELLTAAGFNALALVAQDPLSPVRAGFVNQLKKYLGQSRLSHRWYTPLFLLAFEPDASLKDNTLTWLRSRAAFFTRQQQSLRQQSQAKDHQPNVMETLLARLLSLLAHHPDYPSPTDLDTGEQNDSYIDDLVDLARYILFYLSAIANEENLSLIFHVAQRVKQTRDAVGGQGSDEKLYSLSDLTQATIRLYADHVSHQHNRAAGGSANLLQTWPGKLRLPQGLFAALPSHEVALEIAETNYLAQAEKQGGGDGGAVGEVLEKVVRSSLRQKGVGGGSGGGRKRRSDSMAEGDTVLGVKKARKEGKALPVRKASKETAATPKVKKASKVKKAKVVGGDVPSSENRRRSSRGGPAKKGVSYKEGYSEDDDVEMEGWDHARDDAVEQDEVEEEAEVDTENAAPAVEAEGDEALGHAEEGDKSEKLVEHDEFDFDPDIEPEADVLKSKTNGASTTGKAAGKGKGKAADKATAKESGKLKTPTKSNSSKQLRERRGLRSG